MRRGTGIPVVRCVQAHPTVSLSRRKLLADGARLGAALALGGGGCGGGVVLGPPRDGPDGGPGAGTLDPGAVDPGSLDPDRPGERDGGGPSPPQPPGREEGVLLGLYPRREVPAAEDAVRRACAHLDFGWLGRGDSVLIKVACNSGRPHPAVTSPAAVRALVSELEARGAGRVLVGDQAGVEWARLAPGERRFSSSRTRLAESGLLAAIEASGAEAHPFDERGFDGGYFEATPPAAAHWTRPLFLARAVREVDHVIYLPRLGAHLITGYSAGLKCAVGFLRDDSRNHLHVDAASLVEKYVEISYAAELRSRLRLVLTLADELLLHGGPDAGTRHAADPRLVLAAGNLASHDALAAALLLYASARTPRDPGLLLGYTPPLADFFNRTFVFDVVATQTGLPWGPGAAREYTGFVPHAFERGLSQDRALARAWELEGGRPDRILVRTVGAALAPDVTAALARHGEGAFELSPT